MSKKKIDKSQRPTPAETRVHLMGMAAQLIHNADATVMAATMLAMAQVISDLRDGTMPAPPAAMDAANILRELLDRTINAAGIVSGHLTEPEPDTACLEAVRIAVAALKLNRDFYDAPSARSAGAEA